MKFTAFIAVILSLTVSNVVGFKAPRYLSRRSSPLQMCEAQNSPEVSEEAFAEGDPEGFFNNNKRVRLGRSRDQDGKSNIWSIEPSMTVVDEEETAGSKTNLLVGGLAIGAALACLPLFVAFSKLFPDPTDF